MSKQKVLVVEDEKVIGDIICKIIRQDGYEVIGPVTTGKDAIAEVNNSKPDIILMDVMISGGIDGIDTAKKINEINNIPVLYLTGHSDEKIIQRAMGTGPYGYIIKPVNPRELITAIEIALYKHRMETELKESEEKFYDLYNNAPDMYISVDTETSRIIDCNNAVMKTTGYEKGEILGIDVFALYHPESRDEAEKVFENFKETGEIKEADLKILKKDGSAAHISLSASAIRDNKGKIIKSRTILRDVTEKRNIEVKLSILENSYRTTLNSLPDMISVIDREMNIVLVNDSYRCVLESLGFTGDYSGRNLFEMFDFLTDEIRREYDEVFKTGEQLVTSETLTIKGREFFTETKKVPVFEDGNVNRVLTVINDTTEIEYIERQLIENEERFRLLFDNSPLPYQSLDINGNIIEVNSSWLKILDYEKEQVLGKNFGEFLDGESQQAFIEDFPRFKSSGEVTGIEFLMKRSDGSSILVSLSGKLSYNRDGSFKQTHSIFRDITEQRKAEKQLEFFSSILFNISDSTIATDTDYRIIFANKAAEQLYGYSIEELLGKTPDMLNADEESDEIQDEIYTTISGGSLWKGTLKNRRKDGSIFLCEFRVIPHYDREGEISSYIGIQRDITDNMNMIESLKESEENLRSLYNAADNVAFFTTDLGDVNTKVLDFSPGAEKIFGYNSGEIIGKKAARLHRAGDASRLTLIQKNLKKHGKGYAGESIMVRKSGEEFPSLYTVYPKYNAEGNISGTISVAIDITELKKAEDRLEASITEKDILLKEVHHRVKNNMQVIISLINLQGGYVDDPVVLGFFRDTEFRIRSMALVHEKLYQSHDMSAINFGEYIRALTADITHLYISGGLKGDVNVDVEDVDLGIDRAIPCGIILNELVSNSFKHAFSNTVRGKINIGFHKTGIGEVKLEVSDNGKGLPVHFDISKISSLGMQLVDSLVLQLNGTLEIKNSGGALFTITFPILD